MRLFCEYCDQGVERAIDGKDAGKDFMRFMTNHATQAQEGKLDHPVKFALRTIDY